MNMSASVIKNEPELNRREFVKTAAAGAAGLALMGLPSGKSEAVEKYPHWGKAVVIRDESATDGPNVNSKVVREMLAESIKLLTNGGGWPALFSSYKTGETIGIKVNCQWPRVPTQPKLVSAIVNELVKMGISPDKIVVWDAEWSALIYSAMYLVSQEFRGVRVAATDKLEDPFDQGKTMDIQGNPAHLSRLLTRADHLINVPVLKNHFEAGITFALKNNVGVAGKDIKYRQKLFHSPIDEKNPMHKAMGRGAPIAERIALINTAPDIKNKTRLIVGDAMFGICARGPIGEPEFVYNGLIVGTDPVATDHQARLIIENERKKRNLPFVPSPQIDHAIKLGLGASIDEMKVIPVDRNKKG
jgi:uncharacterized protein (DUF362 family)